jgi:hypothetical protein
MRIVALAETGTRGLLGAVIGGKGERSEVPLARKLVPLLREGMLLLADRAYMTMTAATGSVPGTDPVRASLTAALETAREQVTSARGIEAPRPGRHRPCRPRRPRSPAARLTGTLQRPEG